MIKAGALRTASFSLAFLLVFAPAHVQAANSGTASEAPSPLSAIAHDFTTWLNHAAGNGANNRRAGRHASPSPRPAAAQACTSAAPNKQWSEFITPPGASKKTTPVQIND